MFVHPKAGGVASHAKAATTANGTNLVLVI
jgi:hypothetical protein